VRAAAPPVKSVLANSPPQKYSFDKLVCKKSASRPTRNNMTRKNMKKISNQSTVQHTHQISGSAEQHWLQNKLILKKTASHLEREEMTS